MAKCKVTVIGKRYDRDLAQRYLSDPDAGPCPDFEVGQEFLFDIATYGSMNRGNFCTEAWDAISKYIWTCMRGGSPMEEGWYRDDRVTVACCNDGIRPVIFRIERVEDEMPEKDTD